MQTRTQSTRPRTSSAARVATLCIAACLAASAAFALTGCGGYTAGYWYGFDPITGKAETIHLNDDGTCRFVEDSINGTWEETGRTITLKTLFGMWRTQLTKDDNGTLSTVDDETPTVYYRDRNAAKEAAEATHNDLTEQAKASFSTEAAGRVDDLVGKWNLHKAGNTSMFFKQPATNITATFKKDGTWTMKGTMPIYYTGKKRKVSESGTWKIYDTSNNETAFTSFRIRLFDDSGELIGTGARTLEPSLEVDASLDEETAVLIGNEYAEKTAK